MQFHKIKTIMSKIKSRNKNKVYTIQKSKSQSFFFPAVVHADIYFATCSPALGIISMFFHPLGKTNVIVVCPTFLPENVPKEKMEPPVVH